MNLNQYTSKARRNNGRYISEPNYMFSREMHYTHGNEKVPLTKLQRLKHLILNLIQIFSFLVDNILMPLQEASFV